MSERSYLNELVKIVGEGKAVTDPQGLEPFTVEGVTPGIVLFPENIDQISEIMRLASRESLSVIPMGAGTKRGFGRSPLGADIVLSTGKLNRVIEHESSDLVATTESGIALTELQSRLGAKNQFLPVDPPHAGRGATVGGIIAANDSGPMRFRYGTMRELLIGIKVVRADGAIFKGGSRVVKNVAGYDLPKLFVGSLGTLGIITEATFRLYPVPESSRTYLAPFDSLDKAHDTVRSLIDSNLVMTAIEHITPSLAAVISERVGIGIKESCYALAVRIMNVARAVEDQISAVVRLSLGKGGEGLILEGEKESALWDEIAEFPWRATESTSAVLKAGVVISDVPRVFLILDELYEKYRVHAYASARAANGVIAILIKGDSDSVREAVKELRGFTESSGGSLVVMEASPDIKAGIDVWGEIGTSIGLMRKIKAGFDPENILNPGRLL
jgi:glycolate oxidase FAD binding subunit